MNLETIVEQAIAKSAEKDTKLPASVIDAPGYGSKRISKFLNALCASIPGCRYLEFGTFAGRSLSAAAYGNAGSYRGVDNGAGVGNVPGLGHMFPNPQDGRVALEKALALCAGSDVAVVTSDFRAFKPESAYDVFFYDADHRYEPTRDGIAMVLPSLTPGVLVVDDYVTYNTSDQIKRGTWEALASKKVVKDWVLGPDGWGHTGLFVAVVE